MFAEGLIEAARQLLKIRCLELNVIDEESLKWEWVTDYKKINTTKIEYVMLDSLYMKESYIKYRAIKRYIPLKESGYIKVLKGDKSDIDYYENPGKFEPSRKQKLDFIIHKIKLKDYPIGNKLILVDQEGYIYDGIKRASCLYYLYGGNKKIPVLRIYLPREKSIEEQRIEAEGEIKSWNTKHLADSVVQQQKTSLKVNTEVSEKVGMHEFINRLKKTNLSFFIIDRDKKNEYGKVIANIIIIVEEGKLDIVAEKLDIEKCQSPYDTYRYLYTAPKPLCYMLKEGSVLIFDRICCKNKFEKDILPADKKILKKSWEYKIWNEDWQCYFVGEYIYLLIIIMEALFEKGFFEQKDIDFIERHEKILHQTDFINLLKREFYQYTEQLVNYLLLQQYDRAVSEYDSFSDY